MAVNNYRLCWPGECEPPHAVTDTTKTKTLVAQFRQSGWDVCQPKLVGYCSGDRTILLSGSHRWAAARAANIKIPVVLHNYEDVLEAFGDVEKWKTIMASGNAGQQETS